MAELLSFKTYLRDSFFAKYENLHKIILFLSISRKGKSSTIEILRGNPELRAEGKNGDYLIVNGRDQISGCKRTNVSLNIFPHPIWYEELPKDTCCLDCPGFEDIRSITMDIWRTTNMAMALKDCHSAKIVLVTNYDDVKEGGDSKAFMVLVKMLSEFTQSLDKLENSIALVVNKVPNFTMVDKHDNISFVPDESMKENVASFLLNFRKRILWEENDVKEDETANKNALKLIDMILPKVGGTFDTSRIAMIRYPKKEGLIHQMPQFKEAKANLHYIIHKKLTFANFNISDFNYTISPNSKDYLKTAVQYLSGEISLVLQINFDAIDYMSIHAKSSEIKSVCYKIKEHVSDLQNKLQQISTEKVFTQFFKFLEKNLASLIVAFVAEPSDHWELVELEKHLDGAREYFEGLRNSF